MQTLTFNSFDIPRKSRAVAIENFWSGSLLMNIDLAESGVAPNFEMRGCRLPGVSLSAIAGNASRMARSSSQALAADDEVVLCIARNTNVRVQSRGKSERVFAPGEAHVWLADRETVCEVDGPYTATMLRIPTKAFARASLDLDHILDKGAAAQTPELTLLVDYAQNLLANTEHLSAEAACAAAGHLREMALLALRPLRDQQPRCDNYQPQRTMRLQRLKADIRTHLGHHDLTPHWVAGREGISTRYLRELFAADGTSFRKYVLQHRLELAYRKLSQTGSAVPSISAVAFDTGFSDLSYFCRAFKKQFNMTPSDVRHSVSTGVELA